MNFLCFLLDSCDYNLRQLIFNVCGSYMPVPLIANRPQINQPDQNKKSKQLLVNEEIKEDIVQNGNEILENNQKYLPRVYEELAFTYEKYKGVLAFKVNSNNDRSLRGCSTLTNKIFNRQFEVRSLMAPIANYGQVEIQFDFNFEESCFLAVGDVHGYLQNQELFSLIPQFNIYLIHCFNEDEEEVKNIIDRIDKSSLVFIIKQDDERKQSFITEKEVDQDFIEFNISTFDILNEHHQNLLSLKIHQRVKQYTQQWQQFMQNVNLRLQTFEQFANFCFSFNTIHNQIQYQQVSEMNIQQLKVDYEEVKIFQKRNSLKRDEYDLKLQNDFYQKISIVDTANMIRQFMEQIIKHQHYLQSFKVLPFNEYYSRICRIEKRIYRDCQIECEKIEKFQTIIEED